MSSVLHNRVAIVTACDSTHARSLLQLLQSAKIHAPDTRIIIYDLGMKDFQLRKLRRSFNHEIINFDYAKYPAFFNIKVNAGEYAWKPVIVNEVARKVGGIVYWMDAGNLITAPLESYFQEVGDLGFSRAASGGTIGKWTHPLMLKYFNLATDWNADVEMLSSACVGFDTTNQRASSLLSDWAKYAQIQDCIAPTGSSRRNHRQDQSLLAVLAGRDGWPAPTSARISSNKILIHQDRDFLGDPAIYIRRRIKKLIRWLRPQT